MMRESESIIRFVFLIIFILGSYTLYTTGNVWHGNYGTYFNIMKKMNRSDTIYDLRSHFDRDYDYVELVDWVGNNLEFVNEDEKISPLNDPLKILNYGRGGSREFSILYVAVCLAHGYDARLVVGRSSADKVWAEVKNVDNWIHVDPFEVIIDQPYHYSSYGKTMENVIVFGTHYQENVTSRYFSIEWCSARGESCIER